MRRPRRHRTGLLAGLLICALVLTAPGVAQAGHEGIPHADGELSALIASVAEANQRVADIGADIQSRQEGVNKALVDVVNARDAAQAPRRDVEASQRSLADSNTAISMAQKRFDEFAAAAYVNGPPGSYLSAGGPEDIIATASAGQTLALSFQQALADLQRRRTEQANKASAARAAQQRAEQAAADAQASQDAAVVALTDAQKRFATQQADVDRLVAERDAAQARLDAARPAHAAVTAAAAPVPAPQSKMTSGTNDRPARSLRQRPANGTPRCRWCPVRTCPAIRSPL